jgi:hypothetical protein
MLLPTAATHSWALSNAARMENRSKEAEDR